MTHPRLGVLFALCVVGCGGSCPPLDEVQVHGGTRAENEALSEELARFGATLALPVCIDRVRLVDLDDAWNGSYDAVTRAVRIRPGRPLDALEADLRHEVCHGVDLQNGLVARRASTFWYADPPDAAYRDARLPNEAFAVTCALGAWGLAAALETACPGDRVPLFGLDGPAAIYGEVFGGDAGPPSVVWSPIASTHIQALPPGQVTSDGFGEALVAEGSLGGLFLYGGNLALGWGAWLDPFTGAPIAPDPGLAAHDGTFPRLPPGWFFPSAWGDGAPAGRFGEIDVATAHLALPAGDVDRPIARVEGAWGRAQGPCPAESPQYFSYGEELWWADVSGDEVSWGRWTTP